MQEVNTDCIYLISSLTGRHIRFAVQEVDHLAKHFTDPTFVKMFQEYMEAIADPKVRPSSVIQPT
jgi:hypothetical protein